jgi:hypothetical protein
MESMELPLNFNIIKLILISLFDIILETKVYSTCNQESIFCVLICAQEQRTYIAKGGLISQAIEHLILKGFCHRCFKII